MDDGWWIADIVEDALGPEVKAGTACDRALVIPDTGSDLELGHGFLAAFFFAKTDVLWLEGCAAWVSCEGADTVDVEEDDPSEEEELDRWICFLDMNIRDTSSVFTEDRGPCPPSPELYHPKRGPDCTLGGDATAVMEKDDVVYDRMGIPRDGGPRRSQMSRYSQ